MECNDGYYLPDNDYNQNQCSKCPNNCKKCKNTNYYYIDCIECNTGYYLAQYEYNQYTYYYNPIYYNICLQCNIPGCSKYKPNSNICICIECNTPAEGHLKIGDMEMNILVAIKIAQ